MENVHDLPDSIIEECEGCGATGPHVARSDQFGEFLCGNCLANRQPKNGDSADQAGQAGQAELLTGRVDLTKLITEGIPEREYIPGTD